jgi:hypothetical protein
MAEERQRDERGRFLPGQEDAEQADPESSQQAEPDGGAVDISDTPAPSVGPHTTFEKQSPEERLAGHEQSGVDAMGLDKRRPVVGGRYSPSFARQATIYGVFIAVLAALAIGFIVLANELDQPPETNPDEAPWTGNETPPSDIDFPRYGDG